MADGRDHSSNAPGSRHRRRRPNPLSAALARLRDDPALLAPFLLVGIGLSIVDWLHRRDPIPVLEDPGLGANGIDVRIEFVGYPTGVGQTARPLESLIGLEPRYFAWGLVLYVLPLVAIAAAGAVTMARAMGRSVSVETAASLFGFVVATDLFHRLLGSIDALRSMELWGLLPLVIFIGLLAKLFLVPGLLVAGSPLRTALGESARRTRGRGWTVVGLVLAIGLATWLLALAPLVGTVLTSTLVAPVHAVAIVVLLERDGGASRRSTGAFD